MRTSAKTRARAKALRKSLSPPELKLWMELKRREPGQPVFRRQDPIGPYIADFYCAQARLVIEIDGADHGGDDAVSHDARKDGYMRMLGLRVERIPADQVFKHCGEVAEGLRALAAELAARAGLQPPPPSCGRSPSPANGGGHGAS